MTIGDWRVSIEGELPIERNKLPNGFAAGCEAWLCLAASRVSFLGAVPPIRCGNHFLASSCLPRLMFRYSDKIRG